MDTVKGHMSLAFLLRQESNRLVKEWASYACEHVPIAKELPTEDLEDSARSLFMAIADDIETSQSNDEQFQKSIGMTEKKPSSIAEHAIGHADHRLSQGFTLTDLAAEFRAARASVMRLWATDDHTSVIKQSEIIRVNEALDEALSVSLTRFDAQLSRSRNLFLGVLGHDMRNPLGAIVLSARLLLKDEALSPQSTKSAARIYSSGSRLTKMLDDLLDFTRTRLGRGLPVNLVDGDMGAVIGQVVDELRAYHPAANIVYVTTGNLQGRWDFSRLAQVISNLGGNAIQHGSAAQPVAIRLAGLDDSVELSVSNSGDPIPAEDIIRIFDPMTRATNSIEKGSIGLGLYISRQVALAHQGNIEVRSDTSGTTFTVSIPRYIERRKR